MPPVRTRLVTLCLRRTGTSPTIGAVRSLVSRPVHRPARSTSHVNTSTHWTSAVSCAPILQGIRTRKLSNEQALYEDRSYSDVRYSLDAIARSSSDVLYLQELGQ